MAEQYIREFERDPDDVGSESDGRPDMADFTLEAELLLDLVNEMKAMRSEAIALATGKAGHEVAFRKGPLTAYETVSGRLEYEQHSILVSMLTPRDEHGNRIAPLKADPVSDPDTLGRDTLAT